MSATLARRLDDVEDAVKGLSQRFEKVEEVTGQVLDAVKGLTVDVSDLKRAKLQAEENERIKLETDKRVQEALERHGMEEFPSNLHARPAPQPSPTQPQVTDVHTDQSGNVDVKISHTSALAMIAQYIVETPRWGLGAFLLFLAAIIAGGPLVAQEFLGWATGRVDLVAPVESIPAPVADPAFRPPPAAPPEEGLLP